MTGWLEHLFELSNAKENHVVVTLVGIKGSAPQIVGAKMIVSQHDLHFGTIGGGKIEAHCIKLAQDLLYKKSSSEMFNFNLQTSN